MNYQEIINKYSQQQRPQTQKQSRLAGRKYIQKQDPFLEADAQYTKIHENKFCSTLNPQINKQNIISRGITLDQFFGCNFKVIEVVDRKSKLQRENLENKKFRLPELQIKPQLKSNKQKELQLGLIQPYSNHEMLQNKIRNNPVTSQFNSSLSKKTQQNSNQIGLNNQKIQINQALLMANQTKLKRSQEINQIYGQILKINAKQEGKKYSKFANNYYYQ